MITNDRVLDVVTGFCQYDIDTLLGNYEPFGAHGNVIYSHLVNTGVLNDKLEPTDFGKEVINYVKEYYES